MFNCPFCNASFKHNGVCLRKHIATCSLISSSSEISNNPSKLCCPNCPKKFVSRKTLETHLHKFHSAQSSKPLAKTDESNDFYFDLIGESFFDSSSNETTNFDIINSDSSWLACLSNFISSSYNKFYIMHLNINSVLGLEKRLDLYSILSSNKFDLVVIQESKIGVETPDASLNYPSYQLFRRDRSLGSGGVLLFVKSLTKSYFALLILFLKRSLLL